MLSEAIKKGHIIINSRLPAGKREATDRLIDRLYVLQDALHGSDEPLPAALASFLRMVESGENHG